MRHSHLASFAIAAFAGVTVTSGFAAKNYEEMDYGRFLTASWDNTKGQNTLKGQGCTANKGVAIQLGDKEGAMLFDTDLCRWAGGWTGGYITYKGVIFDGAHGPNPSPAKSASLLFETNPGPTWSKGGSYADPRKVPTGKGAANIPLGPMPKDWVKYHGLFVSGDNVVVNYTIGTASVLEMPALEKAGDVTLLTRTTNVLSAGGGSQNILYSGAGELSSPEKNVVVVKDGDNRIVIVGVNLPAGATIDGSKGEAHLNVSAFTAGTAFKIVYAKGGAADEAKLIAAAKGAAKPADLRTLTKGGPRRWKETVETKLVAGTPGDHDAYVVDTVEIPFNNPYKSWMRVSGFDFFKDGRAAVCTWSGDVWIVSGLNKDFSGQAKWQRVATGIFQALGLKIVNEQIYVHGREGLTRLSDLNGDGEIDFYENFNNDVQTSPGFHEFAFDLQTDSKGNFYFSKAGPVAPGGRGFQPFSDHAGCILKVSPDGQKFEVFATGVRAPNGISVGPGDVVTTGDNEGSWVPMCYVHIVKPGDFVTVASLSHKETQPTDYGRHILFMPKDVDNSGGGQAWVPGNNWGMPAGTLLHMSYGTCSLYQVMHETVDGVEQGGVYKLPVKFDSGTMRGRFNPVDGQLWLAGLKGWQTSAAKDGMLQRVRYTGKPATFPSGIHVKQNGIELDFSAPLEDAAASADKYSVREWNYKWSEAYGSDSYKVTDGKKGTDTLTVKSAKLSADKKKVFLEIDGVQPVMQMEVKFDLKGADGSTVPGRIINTINNVPSGKTAAN